MSEATFFLGVMNLGFISFLSGFAPAYMWLITTLKVGVLVPLVFVTKYKRKTHWYMVDMCWVILYMSALAGCSLLVIYFTNPDLAMEYEGLIRNAMYAYFGFACGPIGLYVVWNCESNLMVFH